MRTFIEQMRTRGLVTDVHDPVSSRFDAPKRAFSTDRLLFFHNLDGRKAVMNLVANRESLAVALGVAPEILVPRLASCRYDGKLVDAGSLPLGPVNLDEIPIMENYPGEAGRYLNSGVVFSRYEGVENASVHRMLKAGKDRLVARLVEGRHTHTLHKRALANGERLPVAVVIGMHPLVLFASCSRVPESMELPFAAELLGGEIPVHTLPNGVRVPDAEIILEGYIGSETAVEGPYVDITRTYDPERIQPVIELTGMYTKPDFIFNCVAVATPHYYVKYPIDTFNLDFSVNYDIIKSIIHHKIPFMHFSSSEVYGKKWESPYQEDITDLTIGPTHKSRWIYATSKIMLEQLIKAHNCEHVIVRPQNFFGWDMDWLPDMNTNIDNKWLRV